MWNTISGNRLIEKRRKEEAHRKHIKALYNIRGKIDNSAPQYFSFLYTRPKSNLLKMERQTDIENHNSILVSKMMKSTSSIKGKNDLLMLKESLNSIYRNKIGREIDEGNQKLVRRLQSAKSQYSKVSKSIKDYDKYKSQMANSRMDPYYDMQTHQSNTNTWKNQRPVSAKR